MREELCCGSYKNVDEILSKYDLRLAELFSRIVKHLMEKICYGENEENVLSIASKNSLFDNNWMESEGINLIPSDKKGACRRDCVVIADGEWKAGKNSFLKLSKVLVRYWLDCQEINMATIIFTNSWDEKSFKKSYKDEFDIYSRKYHAVAVILVASTGFSIQYLGK